MELNDKTQVFHIKIGESEVKVHATGDPGVWALPLSSWVKALKPDKEAKTNGNDERPRGSTSPIATAMGTRT